MEDNENFKTSPKLLSNNKSGLSPDLNLLSPLSKSRYGRTRKPKITEDFYNIDVIFESAAKEFKKSPRTPQPLKPTKSKSLSPKKPTSTIMKPIKKQHTFEHVTGDDLLASEPLSQLSHSNELNSKAIHNFFKSESGMSILHNAAVNNDDSRNKLSSNLGFESVDVTQVLKIISAKTIDENITPQSKTTSKPVLKTYSNKRKSYIKSGIVESFGLPDKPIFPLEKDKPTEPKRIKSLDVAPAASENDINLVDKKLLHTPWKIASMDAEIPELDILLDTARDVYKEDSPATLLNHSISIFEDSTELDTSITSQSKNTHLVDIQIDPVKPVDLIQNAQPDLDEVLPINEVVNMEETKSNKKPSDLIVPECNKLLPKLKQIVQRKILRNSTLKVDNNKKEENGTTKPVTKKIARKVPKQPKVIETTNTSIEEAVKNVPVIVPEKPPTPPPQNVPKPEVTNNEEVKKEISIPKPDTKKVPEVVVPKPEVTNNEEVKQEISKPKPQTKKVRKVPARFSKRLTSPIKKLNPEISNSEISFNQEQSNTVTVKKNERLSLKKDAEADVSEAKLDDVVPLATSPVKTIIKKKSLDSPEKSYSVPKVLLASIISNKNAEVFVSRRGRSSNHSEAVVLVEQIGPVLRNRINKSPEAALETTEEVPIEIPIEIKQEQLETHLTKDSAIKIEEDSDVEYVPPRRHSQRISGKGKKNSKEDAILPNAANVPVEKPLDTVLVKPDPDAISVGDLMWARIGAYPFWPCLVVEEPLSKEFKKTYNTKSIYYMYHVRFFGDRGRRSWVHSASIFPFTSKFDLKNHFHQSKNKANYIVKPSALAKWKIAVKEAEVLLNSTIQERLDFFNEMFILKHNCKTDIMPDLESLEIKKEHLDEYQNEIVLNEEIESRDSLLVNSQGTEKKNRRNKQDLVLIENDPNKKADDPVDKGRTRSSGNVLLTEKNKKKSLPDEKSNSDTEAVNVKEQPDNGTEESNKGFLKNPWKGFTVDEKNLDANSEYSLSDTDSVSKSSSSTPIPNSFEDQITRHRRNNLFRGVNRNRVCQICNIPENVIKCKGPCNGLYHYGCALFDLKNDVAVQEGLPDSTQANEDNGIIKAPSKPLSLAEQIDMKMKEVMQNLQNDTRYADSTTDYSSSEESNCNLVAEKTHDVSDDNLIIRHVTADHISFMNDSSDDIITGSAVKKTEIGESEKKPDEVGEVSSELSKEFQCSYCANKIEPPCYICGKDVSSRNESLRQKCSLRVCGKYYHPKCLKLWPQTQWSLISTEKHRDSEELLDTFVCPLHVCHTCASDDPHAAVSRCGSRKVAKCLRCPATYHTTSYCIPAGTQILSISQIICPRHFIQESVKKTRAKQVRTINTPWCFICSKGGELICCETCPTSVHTECLTVNFLDDDTFICEDCETGRFPLYDEIVWVKLGKYRWWPAVILFPNEVPHNVKIIPHNSGEFVVKFFGTHDHYWVGRGRVFLFQEGDKGHCSPSKKRVDTLFKRSIEEATAAHNIKKIFRKNKEAELKSIVKPPPYIKVKINRPVGNVRQFDGNVSNTTSCECNPLQENPCGPDSDCINRLLLTECDPNVCPAKEKCNNQRFEKRQYPPLVPYKTQGRGWGLKTLAPIGKGQFVIEYVGEIIDDQEYQRRIRKMHEQKDENYYFLIIDKERIIDAGPKGNLARFMNHCCQPNCETQKWTVNGDTRVGLFAIEDIAGDSELTFNYNLECIGKEKKICKCGASNCSGFIGVKVKDESQKKIKKSSSIRKKKVLVSEVLKNDGPCFLCGKEGEVGPCHNKICTKFYHLQCVNLESWPEGKWVCPWHSCNVCSKRTIRCCVRCTNSYCPVHSEGNVRYDKLLGFVCSEHDATKEAQEPEQMNQSINKFKCVDVTEETDVTSTTCDEIEFEPETQEVATPLVVDLGKSLTSTPIKKSNIAKSLKELENNLVRENLQIPESSIPEMTNRKVNAKGGNKRKKRRMKRSRACKKIKLSDSVAKPILRYSTSNLVSTQNEVKLCSSVPTRHLRTRSDTTKIANKRFLRHQSVLEKDLPIRKRSRLRCEITT
ncbi:hypothetical protein RN001_011741 [Aquatica leii]|uniref:Histone-lysine N-methyltransferase NSD2 n=1 Tax=Aquatica leii TaxID=1421715 RepID=A0AAN7P1Z2_9COLE|nr:hypothetical protein RN001_011741 [Aquatica leii]